MASLSATLQLTSNRRSTICGMCSIRRAADADDQEAPTMSSLSILVTGGAGYIGSILVPELLAGGHRVTVLDNFFFQQAPLGHVCANPDFELVRGDIRDENLMAALVARHDVVIPLAALVGAPICSRDPFTAEAVNLHAPLAMVRTMSSEQRLLMPITNSGYGIGEHGKVCIE